MKRCVFVMEAGADKISCAAFAPGKAEPMECWGYPSADINEAARLIRRDLAEKGLRPAKTLLSIHSSRLFMRTLDIPITDRRKLGEVAGLQAADLFLKPADELAIEAMPLEGSRAVVVAVEKARLAEELTALSAAGIEVAWAGPAICSKWLLLKRLSPGEGAFALVDDDSVAAVKDGRPLFFCHLDTADGLLLAVEALEAEGVKLERVFSAGSASLAREAGIEAEDAGAGLEHTALSAVAAQLAEGLSNGVNFLSNYDDPARKVSLGARKKLSWALLFLLVVSWAAFAYLSHGNIRAELASIDARLDKGFTALFPGERPKNPEYALEVRLKELAREKEALAGGVDPLGALSELARAAKGTAVRVHELEASAARVDIKAEAASFEEASAFRDAAARGGYFGKVAITDTRPGQSGKVRFAVSAEKGDK